jgi:hypothetical protein
MVYCSWPLFYMEQPQVTPINWGAELRLRITSLLKKCVKRTLRFVFDVTSCKSLCWQDTSDSRETVKTKSNKWVCVDMTEKLRSNDKWNASKIYVFENIDKHFKQDSRNKLHIIQFPRYLCFKRWHLRAVSQVNAASLSYTLEAFNKINSSFRYSS